MTPDDLMFKPDLMKGQRILITGGGTGLGKEMAEGCQILGAEVYICGRRGGVLEDAAKELMDRHGGKVIPIACDIRVPEAIHDMMEEIWSGGALTGLVNNAAGNFISRTEDLSTRGFDAIANIVFRGSFFVTLEAGKRWLAEKKKASVVSILTTWVWSGGPFTVPSAMSKAGLNVMTQSLAAEWGNRGVRFNAIAPGPFPTEGAWARLNPGSAADGGGAPADRQPAGPGRRDARAGQPRGLPAASAVGVRERPDHRHRRRRLERRRRRLPGPAQLDRRAVGGGARLDPRRQRKRPGAADGLSDVLNRRLRLRREAGRMLARLVFLVVALPALALAADAGGGRTKPAQPTVQRAAARSAIPTLIPPGQHPDAGQCRMGCAQTYYFCRAGDHPDDCAGTWGQCVASCDSPNLATGYSAPP